jgi:Ca2+-binding RTX toxin-like protein
VAPTATLSNNGPVNEGSPVAVTFTNPFDPSTADTAAGFHYSFATDPSQLAATYAAAGAASTAAFTFDDNASYVVYGRIFDKDDGSTDYQTTVVVNNVAPTATLSNDGPVDEGSPAAVTFTNPFDPSTADTAAGFHYSFATDPSQLAATYAAAGVASTTTFTFANSGSYTVYGRILDKDNGYTDYQTTVTVNSVGPNAAMSGPGGAVRGQPQTFTFTAHDPSPAEQAAGFTYTIDWGNGTTTTVSGPGSVQVDHVYPDAGTFPIRVWATSVDGARSAQPGTWTVRVSAAALQGGDLVVGGTTGADTIVLRPADQSGNVSVTINGTTVGTYRPTGRIIVYAQAGDDTVELQSTKARGRVAYITVPAVLFGGDGNDWLDASGSSADNVLVGGPGNDTLLGGNGRDILIGGGGADALYAGKGQDLLIGGATDYDSNLTALTALMAEWGGADLSVQDRINHLTGSAAGGLNGPYLLNTLTVHEDGSADRVFGMREGDWYFEQGNGRSRGRGNGGGGD